MCLTPQESTKNSVYIHPMFIKPGKTHYVSYIPQRRELTLREEVPYLKFHRQEIGLVVWLQTCVSCAEKKG